ncbi:MAG: hypothetical protein OZSIB_0581 [Candidatus Ozemobacter sibiricus]|uniref:Uncharacterized protein n=1 Tax=Candidatus Ozemobacter sibiricus TaxID=2268124 RepID=A0A367Z8X9_9BACT|nr:MAG: hypothetical protein OZSIB_0581 [Candidatus Ozemobacter sibiricus]
MSFSLRCSRPSRGFLLFVILTIILAMSILIFALSSHKSGAIEQLARTIDQNRLVILAQSGNNEMLAFIKDNVNSRASSYISSKFREIFAPSTTPPALPRKIRLFPQTAGGEYCPQETQNLALAAGYNVKIVSQADLVIFGASEVKDMRAFQGYLEVVTRAAHADRPENMVELKERRDVKLVDLRHFFDQYVFFCKNYCPDYNHPRKRLILKGLPGGSTSRGTYSRAYLGNRFYPANKEFADGAGHLWFDLCYDEQRDLIGSLLQVTNRVAFPNSPEDYLFWTSVATFSQVGAPLVESDFYRVEQAKHVFETIVNAAAERRWPITRFDRGRELYDKAMRFVSSTSNDNSAAYVICQDFVSNGISRASARDYAACQGFQQVLRTCFEKWQLWWGYTDANAIWRVGERDPGVLPAPREWVKNVQYGGLASETYGSGSDKRGSYFDWYLRDDFNKERCRVGIMAQLFGPPGGRRPILIEGRAYLRFFKIAFLDDFRTDFQTLTNFSAPEFANTSVIFPPVPIDFRRPDPETGSSRTFQNAELSTNLLTSPYTRSSDTKDRSYLAPFLERVTMSRAVASIPVNCLTGLQYQIPTPSGDTLYNPWTGVLPDPCAAFNPKPGEKYYRCIDWAMLSRDYETGAEFVADRVQDDGTGRKVLYLDGVMLVRKGPLDLSVAQEFVGKGLIFLGEGNCFLGTLKKRPASPEYGENHLRLYLHAGDFEIKSPTSPVVIEASLAALTYLPRGSTADPRSTENQGNLYCNGKSVKILGNLILDYLQLEWGSRGLPLDGTLEVEHDPMIFNPESPAPSSSGNQDPYRISIGEVRTLYSLNAGERSF